MNFFFQKMLKSVNGGVVAHYKRFLILISAKKNIYLWSSIIELNRI